MSTDQTPERVQPLRTAERLITGDRNATYGEPTQDFARTAEFWTTYLRHKLLPDAVIEMHDVALMIDLLKTSRLVWSPGKFDSWVDKAGYVGCGWECAVAEEAERARRRGDGCPHRHFHADREECLAADGGTP